MVQEGIRQLELRGLDFGVEHITLEAACAVTNVPRSSSHAAWAIDDDYAPQAMFRRAVLREWMASREGNTFSGAVEKALARAFEQRGNSMSREEIVRIAVQAAFEGGLWSETDQGSGFNSTDMAIKYTVASQPSDERDADLAEWVRRSELANRDARVQDSYRPLAELLGMAPRPAYGDAAYGHLALALAALVEGLSLRELLLPELGVGTQTIREVPRGEAPATLLGVCCEALVDKFFEPITASAGD